MLLAGTTGPRHGPGDHIKRGALAMRAAPSNDLFVLAKACLDAMTHSDLIDLLNETPRTLALAKALVTQDMITYGAERLPNVVKERRYLIAKKECAHVEKAR